MDISLLPASETYLLKPLDSYNGYGQKKICKEEITDEMTNQYIIQPYIEAKSEMQFYFVNHKLEYARQYIPNKLADNVIVKNYIYSEEEAMIATKFAKLNQNFNGVQRIDFIQDMTDNLLLLEIEDAAPYLSLVKIPLPLQKQFLNDYKDMVYEYYKKNSTKC